MNYFIFAGMKAWPPHILELKDKYAMIDLKVMVK